MKRIRLRLSALLWLVAIAAAFLGGMRYEEYRAAARLRYEEYQKATRLAERDFTIGDYYRRAGKVASAEFYFDKVRHRWPDSHWGVKARAELTKMTPAHSAK